jgi:hypothetical protein
MPGRKRYRLKDIAHGSLIGSYSVVTTLGCQSSDDEKAPFLDIWEVFSL